MDIIQKFKDITPTQIKKWKETKGKLKEISIPVDQEKEPAKFIICKPTRNVLSAIMDAATDKDIDKINELLVSNCILGGDMDKLTEIDTYLTAIEELGKFMETKKAKSKFI